MSCIIIGASHAGVQAAVSLRRQGYEGKVILISADTVLPYQRPPLSKAFLQNVLPEQKLWLRPETFYQQKDIDLMLGKRVTNIDREQRTVSLDDMQCLSYDKLILATGASIRRLTVPGSDLSGVHYLRDYQDTMGIRDSLKKAHNVVVIGGGYIGIGGGNGAYIGNGGGKEVPSPDKTVYRLSSMVVVQIWSSIPSPLQSKL